MDEAPFNRHLYEHTRPHQGRRGRSDRHKLQRSSFSLYLSPNGLRSIASATVGRSIRPRYSRPVKMSSALLFLSLAQMLKITSCCLREGIYGMRNTRRRVYLKITRLTCNDNYNINHDQLARNVFITTDGLTVARHLYDEKAV